MATVRAAIIGTGKPRKTEGSTGFGIAYRHAEGYQACDDCEIVAVADIKRDNAEVFAEKYPGVAIYEDYKEMIAKEKPDIVSVCLWIDLHRPVVLDVIEAGVKTIHCEKPMASRYGEARQMVEAADKAGVQLTFNHQRRFGKPFQEARRIAQSGEIGDLVRLEGSCGNLFDWGTHWFDMMFFFNNETPVEWVIGQIDSRTENSIFGTRMEDQGVSQFKYKNDVYGLLATGPSAPFVGAKLRLVGSKGLVELQPDNPPKRVIRVWKPGAAGWEFPEGEGGLHGDDAFNGAMIDVVAAMREGRRSLLDCHYALQATEMIFATYESSRRRARVDLPLDIDDSPFLSMLEEGVIGPKA